MTIFWFFFACASNRRCRPVRNDFNGSLFLSNDDEYEDEDEDEDED